MNSDRNVFYRLIIRPVVVTRLAVAAICLGAPAGGAPGANLDLGVRDYSSERGYRLLIERPYLPPLLDQELFDQLWQTWEEPRRSQAEAADSATRRQMTLSRYGLTEAPGRAGGPPLQFAVDPVSHAWSVNCLLCHGGKVLGQTLPGLANSHVAMQTLYDEVTEAKRRLGRPVPEIPEKLRVPLGGSNGTTNAIIFGVLLGSQRDGMLNYRPQNSVPVLIHNDHDAPSWWYLRKKTHLYADGHSPKDHRAIMAFMLDPANGPAEFQAAEDDYREILAWIDSLEAPRWPWALDQALADSGREVFSHRCAECHGEYGATASYPNRIVPIDEVGTDRARLDSIAPIMRYAVQFTWLGSFGKKKTIVDPGGYVAPPLDGIWASAPYLHNGSVPTLVDLFYPERRPLVWRRSEDGYDQANVGLEVERLNQIPAAATDPRERRTYFDAGQFGKTNVGHPFPAQLDEAEKRAVLEYLKTL